MRSGLASQNFSAVDQLSQRERAEAILLAETLDRLEMEAAERAAGIDAFAAERADPATFARRVLEIHPWSRQEELLAAVPHHNRIAVRSGHKVSKSNSAGIIATWWTSDPVRRPGARVVMTSSSSRQVKAVLWRELTQIHTRVGAKLGGHLNKLPSSGWIWPDGREILGYTAGKGETMAGPSGAHLLYLLDEASGIDEAIFETIEGNSAGGTTVVMFGNPTRQSGTFFDAFHGKRRFWHTIHISSAESPNVVAGKVVVPGLATREWYDELVAKWGIDSIVVKVRAHGEFAGTASNAVVGLEVVERAIARWHEAGEDEPDEANAAAAEDDAPLEFGVDPARFGDDKSTITARRGWRVLEQTAPSVGMDGPDLAGQVLRRVRALRRTPSERPRVKVDVVGWGASCYDALARSDEVLAIAVNSGSGADRADEFVNLRAQLHFDGADWLKNGGAVPDSPDLVEELIAPTFKFAARNRIQVESKPDIKARLGRSPDWADSFLLSVYEPPMFGTVQPTPEPDDTSRWAGYGARDDDDAPARGF